VIQVKDFEQQFISLLPETYELLTLSNLTVHPTVSRIIIHGYRGLAGGYGVDSDVDLSLVVEAQSSAVSSDREGLLQEIVETTLHHWQAFVEVDLAVVFDTWQCGLKCFDQTVWNEQLCMKEGIDCFGLYKVQKGFRGLVTNSGVQVKLMYPCLTIWRRK
jgi:hypothetical protein